MLVPQDLPADWDPLRLNHGTLASQAMKGLAVYGALMMLDPESGEPIPYFAESVESTDGLTWTIRLGEGLQFSDGTPYDADAVRFNIGRAQDPENRAWNAAEANEIAEMEVVDPLTLAVTLHEINTQWPKTLAIRFPFIASPTALDDKGEQFGEEPVGAGPFVLKEWRRDDLARLTRNPNYFEPDRPYLDELTFRVVPDPGQAYETLATGSADVYLSADEQLASEAEEAGLVVFHTPVNGSDNLTFNTERPPFDDVRLRRALAHAVDVSVVNDVWKSGFGEPAMTEFLETSPYHDSEGAPPEHDLPAAQALIDEIREESGSDIEFTILVNSARTRYAEVLQSQFSALDGVSVDIEVVSADESFPRALAGEFQAWVSTWVYRDPDPVLYNALKANSPLNLGNYTSPDMESALAATRSATTEAEARDAWQDVVQLMVRDQPWLRLLRPNIYHFLSSDVQGFEVHADGAALLDGVWMAS